MVPSPMIALNLSSSPEFQRSLDSYQVLNADGSETRQFRLPRNRRSFPRAHWIARKLHSTKVVSSLHDYEEALEQNVNEAIEELKKRKHPSYRDVLQPLFSIFPVMTNIMSSSAVAESSGRLLTSFSDLLSLIVNKSAEFLKHSETQQEGRLSTPRGRYRALTNFWVYLIVGYCLDHNDHDDEDKYKMVYAYSFIYPYMDDLLDKQSFQSGAKKKLIANITHQIESRKIPDTMAFAECGDQDALERECRIYELLDQVLSSESSSSSSSKSTTPLQESLLAINMAQRASLQQHVDWTDLRAGVMAMPKSQKALVWQISINKGVSSVIPNAYFHAPAGITKEQAGMVAVIGYMGQFLNDIEGLHEDKAEKSLTPALISFLKHGTLIAL
jgi:VanZ family protein